MRTRELINALVADRPTTAQRPEQSVAIAVGVGAIISVAVLILSLGIRADIANAALSTRFLAKVAIALSLAMCAVGLTSRLCRPDASLRPWIWFLAVPPLLLIVAAVIELYVVPVSQWEARLFGAHWMACLFLIPLFALPPLAGLLIALKRGAPRDGGVAGAIAGIAAGGVGATIYVIHCPDDSALFLAAWYTLAVCIVSLLGHFAGKRWLKW